MSLEIEGETRQDGEDEIRQDREEKIREQRALIERGKGRYRKRDYKLQKKAFLRRISV